MNTPFNAAATLAAFQKEALRRLLANGSVIEPKS